MFRNKFTVSKYGTNDPFLKRNFNKMLFLGSIYIIN